MTTDYKVTELFCIIDEFCKHFDAENAGNLLEDIIETINDMLKNTAQIVHSRHRSVSNFHCSKDRIISFDSLYIAHV